MKKTTVCLLIVMLLLSVVISTPAEPLNNEHGYCVAFHSYPNMWYIYDSGDIVFKCTSDKFPTLDGNKVYLGLRNDQYHYIFYTSDYARSLFVVNYKDIGDAAFREWDCISSATLTAPLSRIGSEVFAYCTGLQDIYIPDSVTYIHPDAFKGCSASLVYHCNPGSYADLYLSELGYRVQYPEPMSAGTLSNGFRWAIYQENKSIVVIGGGAFSQKASSELNDIIHDNESTVTTAILAAGITNVGPGLFRSRSGLTKVMLSSTITAIEDDAFYQCTGLTNISLPEGLGRIGSFAFGSCANLKSLTLPASLTQLGDDAFANCTSLTEVTLPASVSSIGISPFIGCTALQAINVPSGNSSFCSVNGVLYDKSVHNLIQYPTGREGGFTVPGTVTGIAYGAFARCGKLTYIMIPGAVSSIYDNAFDYVPSSTVFYVEPGTYPETWARQKDNTVIPISGSAGSDVSWTADLPTGTVTFSGSGEIITNDDLRAMLNGGLITNAVINPGITVIGDSLFHKCTGLQTVSLPSTLTCIRDYAFYNCTKLVSIGLPEGLTDIGIHAFHNCTRLESIDLPEGVTGIGSQTFYNCTRLESIDLPEGLTSIGDYAFYSCTELESIDLPEGLTDIGSHAFSYCTSLTSLILPESLESVGNDALMHCDGLTTLRIPANVTFFGENSFHSTPCQSLQAYTVAEENTVFMADACGVLYTKDGTTLLSYPAGRSGAYVVPAGVTTIQGYAFDHCTLLTSVSLPGSVTGIGGRAFGYCSGLADVVLPASVTSIGSTAFDSVPKAMTVTCIPGSYADTCTATAGFTRVNMTAGRLSNGIAWSLDTDNVLTFTGTGELTAKEGEIKKILDAYSIEHVVADSRFTAIGSRLFYSCAGLRTVTLPAELTSIGDRAFYSCTGLESIDLPEGLTGIGSFAFSYCSSLTSLILPESLESVGNDAFMHCDGLTTLRIPASVTFFGGNASHSTPCESLQAYTVAEENTAFMADACGVLYTKDGTTLLSYPAGRSGAYEVPVEVTTIQGYAFDHCRLLTSVSLPGSVTSIGGRAFNNCTGLTNAVLPASVTSISSNAFDNVLETMTVTCIPGSYADTCSATAGLTRVRMTAGRLSNGFAWSLDTDNVLTFTGTGELTVKEGEIKKILDAYSIEHVVLSPGITAVGTSAFYKCSTLLSVSLPEGLTSIGSDGFYSCVALRQINLPSTLRSLNDFVFFNCPELTEIALPGGITDIGMYAFAYCEKLTGITLPLTVSVIGNRAFFEMQEGFTITCPEGSYADTWATSNGFPCTYMTSGVLSNGFIWSLDADNVLTVSGMGELTTLTDEIKTLLDASSIGTVILAQGITSVGQEVFRNCRGLQAVTLPEGMTDIGYKAFYNCSALSQIHLPSSLTGIGDYVFYNCRTLEAVQFPEGLIRIGNGAFNSCSELGAVTFPESLTTVGDDAFSYCGMTELHFPAALTSFGTVGNHSTPCMQLLRYTVDADNPSFSTDAEGVLYNKDGTVLLSYPAGRTGWYRIPGGVVSIEEFAFFSCTGVTAITFPGTVTAISDYTFSSCTGLVEITLPATVTSIGDAAFNRVPDDLTVICEENSYAWTWAESHSHTPMTAPLGTLSDGHAWALADGERLEISGTGILAPADQEIQSLVQYYGITRIDLNGELTAIGDAAFAGCAGVIYCSFPDTLQSIGAHAFEGCTDLCSILLPDGFSSLGEAAFRNCTALYTVYYSPFVTVFPDRLFENCISLSTLCVPSVYGASTGWSQYGGGSITSIGNYTFSGCTALYGFLLPDTMTQIGSYAFADCLNLREITVPDTVTAIGEGAFSGCIALETAVLPTGLTSLSAHMFDECQKLAVVPLPDTLKHIGAGAFRRCDALEYIALPTGLTSIGESAFLESGLKTITVPDTVTDIGECAFSGCSGLASAVLPAGLRNISTGLFRYDDSLKSLTLPAGLISIGDYAFSQCYTLENIVLPESLTAIGDYAFQQCHGLISITLPDGVTVIGEGAFLSCAQLARLTLPASLTVIGDDAFSGCLSLLAVNFPDTLTAIGANAFKACSFLSSVVLPDSVSTVGRNAFSNCVFLRAVTLPAHLANLSEGIFENCQSLSEIVLPEGILSVDADAFSECLSLKYITLPESLTAIRENAFTSVPATMTVYCPVGSWAETWAAANGFTAFPSSMPAGGVSGILSNGFAWSVDADRRMTLTGTGSFGAATDLEALLVRYQVCELILSGGITGLEPLAFYSNDGLKSVTLPEGLTAIGAGAFNNCGSLTRIVLPSTLTGIGSYAFNNCFNLAEVTLPTGLTAIGEYAFLTCYQMTSVTFPAALSALGEGAFQYCVSLTDITLTGNDLVIDAYAFSNCRMLTSVILQGVTEIGEKAFEDCAMLTDIMLPEGLTAIDNYAFSNCTQLSEMTLPSTLSRIERNTFSYCLRLAAIHVRQGSNTFSSENGVLYDKDRTALILYPQARAGSYEIPAGVTSIDSDTFADCNALTEITLPAGMTVIGDNAFSNCKSLSAVHFSSGLTEIGNFAFANCSSLADLSVPDSVHTIGNNAFNGCTALGYIHLPASLTSMNSHVFFGCSSLSELIVPNSVTEIQNRIVSGCIALKHMVLPSDLTLISNMAFDGVPSDIYFSCEANSLAASWIAARGYRYDLLTSSGTLSNGFIWNIDSGNTMYIYGDGPLTLNTTVSSGNGQVPGSIPEGSSTVDIPAAVQGELALITLQHGVSRVSLSEGITSVGSKVFNGCTGISALSLPESLTRIGDHAFLSCSSLEHIGLPAGVTYIGQRAFFGCTNLRHIEVATNNPAFANDSGGSILYNKSLTELIAFPAGYSSGYYIPDSVISIGDYAFSGSTILSEVFFSPNVTTIGNGAFDSCRSLASIRIPATVTEIGEGAFNGTADNFTVHCYEGSFAASWAPASGYAYDIMVCSHTESGEYGWPVPATRTEDGLTAYTICSECFLTTKAVSAIPRTKTLFLPAALAEVDESAFEGASMMQVTVPEGVTSIGNRAIANCRDLEVVILPSSVRNIGTDIFSGSPNVTVLTSSSYVAVYCIINDIPFLIDGEEYGPD